MKNTVIYVAILFVFLFTVPIVYPQAVRKPYLNYEFKNFKSYSISSNRKKVLIACENELYLFDVEKYDILKYSFSFEKVAVNDDGIFAGVKDHTIRVFSPSGEEILEITEYDVEDLSLARDYIFVLTESKALICDFNGNIKQDIPVETLVLYVIANDRIIFYDTSSGLHIVDRDSDKLIKFSNMPVLITKYGNMVYLWFINGDLVELNVDTGDSRLLRSFKNCMVTSLSATSKSLYLSLSSGEIYEVNIANPEDVKEVFYSIPFVYLLDATPENIVFITNANILSYFCHGDVKWQYEIIGKALALVNLGETIYLLSRYGNDCYFTVFRYVIEDAKDLSFSNEFHIFEKEIISGKIYPPRIRSFSIFFESMGNIVKAINVTTDENGYFETEYSLEKAGSYTLIVHAEPDSIYSGFHKIVGVVTVSKIERIIEIDNYIISNGFDESTIVIEGRVLPGGAIIEIYLSVSENGPWNLIDKLKVSSEYFKYEFKTKAGTYYLKIRALEDDLCSESQSETISFIASPLVSSPIFYGFLGAIGIVALIGSLKVYSVKKRTLWVKVAEMYEKGATIKEIMEKFVLTRDEVLKIIEGIDLIKKMSTKIENLGKILKVLSNVVNVSEYLSQINRFKKESNEIKKLYRKGLLADVKRKTTGILGQLNNIEEKLKEIVILEYNRLLKEKEKSLEKIKKVDKLKEENRIKEKVYYELKKEYTKELDNIKDKIRILENIAVVLDVKLR